MEILTRPTEKRRKNWKTNRTLSPTSAGLLEAPLPLLEFYLGLGCDLWWREGVEI